MGKGFAKKKKQMRELQEQFGRMQEELKAKEAIGEASGGLVKITLNGDSEIKEITINPECVDPEDVEGLEDLIKEAHNNAKAKLGEDSPGMPDLGGMGGGMPDLSSLFGG